MTYIITGASRSIGKYLRKSFQDRGCKVIGTYHQTIEDAIQQADYYQVDIADYKAVQQWIQSLKADLDKIVLINCAGISYNAFAHKADMDVWEKVIDVNIKGTFHVIREVLPIMREQGYGRIINFSSVVAQLPTPGVSAYATSKSALLGLTKSLAVENASKGITINAINLGYVSIGMGVNDVPPAYQEKIKSQIPSGRFCSPEEILRTVDYLINTEYINGASIDVNGGLI
ncbi:MAG TPA: SDR family oxidoreductase [Bacteroidales bacterium]|nr:SDR family oxidoreductase [Bacteroidales bacterium]HOR82537.1 SDR family oxidoreductase [Bacteroidales bacterium]HPL09052.1 SDR family oxidoreductase [Clostridia bacterium]